MAIEISDGVDIDIITRFLCAFLSLVVVGGLGWR